MNIGVHVSFKIRVLSVFLEVLRKRKHVGWCKILKGRQDSLPYLQAFGPGQSSPSVMRYQLSKADIFVHLILCLKGGYISQCNLYFIEAGREWSCGHLYNFPAPHWVTYRNHVPFLALRFLNYEMKISDQMLFVYRQDWFFCSSGKWLFHWPSILVQ